MQLERSGLITRMMKSGDFYSLMQAMHSTRGNGRQYCGQGVRFAFNCYRHWAMLVIRGKAGEIAILSSKEGAPKVTHSV